MRSESSRIAVIVVEWNSGELLQRCITSLLQQTVLPKCIVVVDNGDGTKECEVAPKSDRIELVCAHRNLGFAAANNRAAIHQKIQDCEWLALINPDAVADECWLERMVRAADGFGSTYAFLGSRLINEYQRAQLDGAGDIYHVSGSHWRRGYGELAEGNYGGYEEIFSPCAAAAFYRKDVFLEIGGFDESFFCYAEDMDLGFRLRVAGHRCLYVPDAFVYHIGSAITGRRSDFTVYHGHRNLVWVFVKNMPGVLLWLYLPQHLLFNLVSIVWYTVRGQGRVILRAKWDAIKGLPRVWAQRKAIQAKRKVGVWELRRLMARGWLTPYLRRR